MVSYIAAIYKCNVRIHKTQRRICGIPNAARRLRYKPFYRYYSRLDESSESDFFVRQVACWILAPDVARCGLAARAEVSAAKVEPAASAAASLDEFLFPPHEGQKRVRRRIAPYPGERLFKHVADGMIAPELIGIDGTIPGYAGYALPG